MPKTAEELAKEKAEKARAAEQVRQNHNANARTQAANLNSQKEAKEAERQMIANHLERLNSAKTKLDAKIKEYSEFKKAVSKYPSTITAEQFKGTNRDSKWQPKMSEFVSAINDNINKHQSNMSELNLKIAGLEAKQGDIISAIGSLAQAAQSWLSSIF